MDFVVANQQAIAEAAKIVPMTDEQASEAKYEARRAGGGPSLMAEPRLAAASGAQGVRVNLTRTPSARSRFESGDQGRARSRRPPCRS